MVRGRFVLFFLFMLPVAVLAQKVKTVHGSYTYYAPENVTPEQARQTALERARIQALADAYGTTVSQTNLTHVGNTNGASTVDFQSIGMSEVKGVWLEDTTPPDYAVSYEGGMQVVSVTVQGKARELVHNKIDCDIHLLRNGHHLRDEATAFIDGDQFFLRFRAPVKGYLAVYLLDSEGTAYCLLPYPRQEGIAFQTEANTNYLFFDRDAIAELAEVSEEYYVKASHSQEHNQIYVIFSPHEFAKALDEQKDLLLPGELREDAFQRWLVKCRRHDPNMQLTKIPITIRQQP